jgi:hypothetical protein
MWILYLNINQEKLISNDPIDQLVVSLFLRAYHHKVRLNPSKYYSKGGSKGFILPIKVCTFMFCTIVNP